MRKHHRRHSRTLFVAIALSIAAGAGAWALLGAKQADPAAPVRIAVGELRSDAAALALVARGWHRDDATAIYTRRQARQLADAIGDTASSLDDPPPPAAAQAREAQAHAALLLSIARDLDALPPRGDGVAIEVRARGSRDALRALEQGLKPP
jgi:hypothetical protein